MSGLWTARSSTSLLRSTFLARADTRLRQRAFLSTESHPDNGPPLAPQSSYIPPLPNTPNVGSNPIRSGLDAKKIMESRQYRLYVLSTRNNIITNFTKDNGNTIACFTGGSCGFKKVNRSSYEAGYQCAVRTFARILEDKEKEGPLTLEILFKGFGQGRDALQKALLSSEGEMIRPLVVRVTDRTPLKVGGARAKKARRL